MVAASDHMPRGPLLTRTSGGTVRGHFALCHHVCAWTSTLKYLCLSSKRALSSLRRDRGAEQLMGEAPLLTTRSGQAPQPVQASVSHL